MKIDVLLFGSYLDYGASRYWQLSITCVLLVLLWLNSDRASRASTGGRIAVSLALLGAALQVFSGDMLVFLAGGSVLGFSMLALALLRRDLVTSTDAMAITFLLVVGDLALLELLMTLAKSAPELRYREAAAAYSDARGGLLASGCFALGFGSRMALPLLCFSTHWRNSSRVSLLPGWALIAFCAGVGALRLGCTGSTASCDLTVVMPLLWSTPLLALLALILAGRMLAVRACFLRAGDRVGALRKRGAAGLPERGESGVILQRLLVRAETAVTDWPLAMALFTLVLIICAVSLLMGALR